MSSVFAFFKVAYEYASKGWTFSSDFIKNHWNIIMLLLFIGLAYTSYRLLQRNKNDYLQTLQQMQLTHDEELKKILINNEEERKQHEQNVKKLQEQLEDIQKIYQQRQQVIEQKKQTEIKGLITEFGDKPDELARRLSSATGFQVIY